MKIVRVAATPLNVPLRISFPGIERRSSLEGCVVEVETDAGITGHGLAAITRETVIAHDLVRPLTAARRHALTPSKFAAGR